MTSDHSFDPRTWRTAPEPIPVAPAKLAAPLPAPASLPGEPARGGWLGLALSVMILLAGAAAAYATRPAADELEAASLSSATSASG